jgi:putative transposase
MRKSRLADGQIVSLLHQDDAGAPIADLCRVHEISRTTYCCRKRRYCGMAATEAQRLLNGEEENCCLKFLLADQAVNIPAFTELLGKQ